MTAPVKKGGLIWNSTLKGGAAAACLAFAARAASCYERSGLLLGAAPAMSLGEDNSWRSLATAAASACVWAFFCVVAALLLLAAALNSFGSSARRSGWNARLAGVLLASTARLAAAGPANASVAPFSDDFLGRVKLHGVRERRHHLQDAAGEDVEPLVEEGRARPSSRTAVSHWLAATRPTPRRDVCHISSSRTDMSYGADMDETVCNEAAASFDEDIGAWDASASRRWHGRNALQPGSSGVDTTAYARRRRPPRRSQRWTPPCSHRRAHFNQDTRVGHLRRHKHEDVHRRLGLQSRHR